MSQAKRISPPIAYSDTELSWIESNQAGISREALSKKFNNKFNRCISAQNIAGLCKRNRWANGRDTRIKKGDKSWNKGITGYMGANKTSFKKGNIPFNHKPVGHERVTEDGYIMVKVAEPNKFRLKQLVVWEAHHGKLKDGYNLRFLDNDRTNCNIDNLMSIPRSVNAIVNNRNPANTRDENLNKSILLTESITWHANNLKCR
ncbi:HNH endonuclease signature motif containing protein [Psychrobacter sp. PAMC 21119]|uniref:HNH endonuclease signature motif containing protein n=1 Tax=Psychrobacter sp. PAMC 21119 TaxID=1112209 RepID=UPI00028A3F66|nr:HNH endonuclease signature motif containing protein [Psychrobacter sp. PAMC 21119]